MKKILALSAAVLMTMSTGAFAASSWDTGISRGLDVYSIKGATSSLKLICDPDKVFGENADETKLLVQIAGNDAEGPVHIAFDSADYPTISLTFAHGVSLKKAAEPETWQSLVDGLASGIAFAIVTANAKEIYQPKAALKSTCN